MPSKRFLPLSLCLLTGLGLTLSGCGGSGGGGGGPADPVVMFVNACEDGPVSFFMNDVDMSGSLAYNGATKFISFESIDADQGAHDVSVEEPDRSVSYDMEARLFSNDTSSLIIGIGVKNPPDGEQLKRLKLHFFDPDRNAPIGNRARLIFVHAFNRRSPFMTPNLILKTSGDNPLFQTDTTSYGETDSIDVDSGTYRYFGVDDPRNNYLQAKDPVGDQVYAENKNPARPVVLAPGGIYLVLVSGVEAANSVPGELKLIKVEAKTP